MNDAEKWADLEGPEPEAVRELFDPLRAALPSRAEAEDMARELLEKLAVQEDGAAPEAELPLRFEAWAELSASLIGAGPEERFEVLDARDLGVDDWTRCETHYFKSLTGELAAGRKTRIELYARLCGEAVARRKVLPEAAEPEAPAVAAALPPAAAAAAPTEVATFQKIEQSPALAPVPERKSNPLAMTAGPVQMSTAMRADQGKLPFVPAAPAPPPLPGTEKTVPLRAGMGATKGPDPIAKLRASLPFLEQTGVNAVPFPRMEVATFALLTAEIVVNPQDREATLTKYKVSTELSFSALENHWLVRMKTHPEIMKEFAERLEMYKTWMRSQKK